MKKPNILLLVLDSARYDRIFGEKGQCETETLDNLRRESVSFTQAYSTGSWTVPAHGSLFTGSMPTEHGAHAKNKHLTVEPSETLAGKLSSNGYTSAGFSTNPWITNEFGFTAGFDEFKYINQSLLFDGPDPRDEDFGDGTIRKYTDFLKWCLSKNGFKRFVNGIYYRFLLEEFTMPAEVVNDNVFSWLREQDNSPFFLFINYMDAHEPYRARSEYLQSDVSTDWDAWNLHSKKHPPEQEDEDKIRQLYDASISYLDKQLGRLLSQIDLEDTLLLILSDHGQSLGEQGYWGHGTYLYEELVHVPLLVRQPGDDSARESHNLVSIADIPRYIFDSIGLQFDEDESHSFTASDNRENSVVIESHGPHQDIDLAGIDVSEEGYRSVYLSDWRATRHLDTDHIIIDEVAGSDKGSIPIDAKAKISEIESKYEDEIDSSRPKSNTGDISSNMKERLKDLGYY